MTRIKSRTYFHQYYHTTGLQLDSRKLQSQGIIEKTIGYTDAKFTPKQDQNCHIHSGFTIPNGMIANLFEGTIIVVFRKTYSLNVPSEDVTASLYRLLHHFHHDERFYFYHYDDTYDLVIFKEASWPTIVLKIQKINMIATSPEPPRFQFQFLAFDNLDPAPINRIIEFAGELMIKSCHSNNLGTLVSYTKKVSD